MSEPENFLSRWSRRKLEPDPSRPSTDTGIYDVKSGAEGTTLEGTPCG